MLSFTNAPWEGLVTVKRQGSLHLTDMELPQPSWASSQPLALMDGALLELVRVRAESAADLAMLLTSADVHLRFEAVLVVDGGRTVGTIGGDIPGILTLVLTPEFQSSVGVTAVAISKDAHGDVQFDPPQGGALFLHQSCFEPYTTINDAWRSIDYHSRDDNRHCDTTGDARGNEGTGVGGGNMFRFVPPAGFALPLQPQDFDHCGTHYGGWMSGMPPGEADGTTPPDPTRCG
eukprot:COSAG04_NODE_10002_length_813_cov_499.978992_1_plen_232_part_10